MNTHPISRRRIITSSGLFIGALTLPIFGAGASRAAAPILGVERPTFTRFKVGAFDVTTINDGVSVREEPHSIFGTDQDPATVGGLLEENLLPQDRLAIGFAPVLVNTGTELVLFDTGLGEGARENGLGQLTLNMATAGYSPDQVDIVVITHMHPDHIGGLMEAGGPAFPNARYVTAAVEFDFWSPDERLNGPTERVASLVDSNVEPLAEQFTFIGDDTEITTGITGLAAFGHTPGHMIYHIESEGQRLAITADAANHYVLSLQQPDWHARFDMDKEAAAQTRRQVFGMLAAERIPFTGYHMPFPSTGFVEAVGSGFRYIPASYQLEI